MLYILGVDRLDRNYEDIQNLIKNLHFFIEFWFTLCYTNKESLLLRGTLFEIVPNINLAIL